MRLLNSSTFEFKEFFDVDLPPYAILSHKWGTAEQEVSYKDLVKGRNRDTTGWAKLEGFAAAARRDGHDWIWVDTCCIDKRSSAELSEAINSMFAWYRRSTICYVWLVDVEDDASSPAFGCSEWFKRGWTLQELLAPKEVDFYNRGWQHIGTKRELARPISTITLIPQDVLSRLYEPQRAAAATILSWAARRETTRAEDAAYCLLGLLQVNMPLLYGEGRDALQRLQLKILDERSDRSLLAFCAPDSSPVQGILAKHVSDFASATADNGRSAFENDMLFPDYLPVRRAGRWLDSEVTLLKIQSTKKDYYIMKLDGVKLDGKLCYVALNRLRAPGRTNCFLRLAQTSLTLPFTIPKNKTRLFLDQNVEVWESDLGPSETQYIHLQL